MKNINYNACEKGLAEFGRQHPDVLIETIVLWRYIYDWVIALKGDEQGCMYAYNGGDSFTNKMEGTFLDVYIRYLKNQF